MSYKIGQSVLLSICLSVGQKKVNKLDYMSNHKRRHSSPKYLPRCEVGGPLHS